MKLKHHTTKKTPAIDLLRYAIVIYVLAFAGFIASLALELFVIGEVSIYNYTQAGIAIALPACAGLLGYAWSRRVDVGQIPVMTKHKVAKWAYLPYETQIVFNEQDSLHSFVNQMQKRGSWRVYCDAEGDLSNAFTVRFKNKGDASWTRLRYHNPNNSA